jgi:hypothetical protein
VNNLNPGDLSDLERAVLAILAAGLVSSAIANDGSFRLDYLTAMTLAALRDEAEDANLTPDGAVSAEFQQQVCSALFNLADRRVLSLGSAPAAPLLTVDGPAAFVADRSVAVNFDEFPSVFDRYLAGRCLDEVLRNPDAYRFVMGKYADSSEIWQRLYKLQR